MTNIFVYASVTALFIGFTTETMATEWNVSVWGQRRAFTEHIEKLAELVSEKTGGEFTMNISYGGLSEPRANLEGISTGAFAMAQFCAGDHRDKNRVITVLELPFLGVSNLEEEAAVSAAVYAHPAATEEMARWKAKLLMATPTPQYNIVGSGDPPDTLAKFDGLSVRATGGISQAVSAVGATPQAVPMHDVYQALENGQVTAVAFPPNTHLSFGTIEHANWWTTNLNLGTVNCPVVVSIDAYQALSNDERLALDSSTSEALDHYLDNYNALLGKWDDMLAEKSVRKVRIDEAEIVKFRKMAAEKIHAKWIADMESQNLPGQELYDLVIQTLKKRRCPPNCQTSDN